MKVKGVAKECISMTRRRGQWCGDRLREQQGPGLRGGKGGKAGTTATA